MSGVTTGTLLAVGAAAALSAGTAIYGANQQSKSAKDALNAQNAQNAALQANKPQQAKAPGQDTTAAIGTGTNALGAGNFNSNTLLTGAQGVTDPLNLAKNKLSGGASTTDPLGGANTLLGA